MRKYNNNRTKFYDGTQIMGYAGGRKVHFFYLIGGRGCGKTVFSQDFALNQFKRKGIRFMWLRLKEPSVKALLARDGADFFDPYIIEKHHITDVKTDGSILYVAFNNGPLQECGRVMALSTFYAVKGVALNKKNGIKVTYEKRDENEYEKIVKKETEKYGTIILDEMQAEKCERKTFDICYAFVNTLETTCRLDTDRRIICTCNLLEEGSDILSKCVGFIPNDYGLYYIPKKWTIIHMIEDSAKYKQARAQSFAGILAPEESTFTNKIDPDLELISKNKLGKVIAKIQFDDRSYFTLHEGNVISKQKIPKGYKVKTIAMQPWINKVPYIRQEALQILELAQLRQFKFDMLLTLKLFIREMKSIRGANS